MGARGPAPKPTRLRVLHGDHPERVNRSEPRPASLPVHKPPYLSDIAGQKWDELAPHLESMGIMSACDGDLLAAYCECYARWRRLAEQVATSPPTYSRRGRLSADGTAEQVTVRNPAWSQVRDAEAALRVLAREFGFTPSARSGLRVEQGMRHAAERLLNGDK